MKTLGFQTFLLTTEASLGEFFRLTLVKVLSSGANQSLITNNFYQSLTRLNFFGRLINSGSSLGQIKKRIIMIHKNASNSQNQWKLLLILPLLGVFLWSFNVEGKIKYNDYSVPVPVIDSSTKSPQLKEEIINPVSFGKKGSVKEIKPENKKDLAFFLEKKNNKHIDSKISVTVNKNTSDEALEKLKILFKENYGVMRKFNGIKRNSAGEIIKIKVSMKSEKSNASFNQDDNNGINEFKISYNDETGSISIGNNNLHYKVLGSNNNNHFIYEIKDGEHTKVKSWKSKDHKDKYGLHEYIIHENDDKHFGDEIHIISGSGKKSTVWVTKDENHVKKGGHNILIERHEEHDGDGNIFYFNSDEEHEGNLFFDSESDDTIFINNGGKSGIFIAGNKGDTMMVYIDGKKSTKEAMEALESSKIDKVEVIKGDKATKEYGEGAKDGVILITTKKN